MANHAQAEKRNRQRIRRQAHNRHVRATMRTMIKRVRAAIDENDAEKARQALLVAVPTIDRGAQKGVVPRKRASRTISRLTKAVTGIK